MRLALAAFGAVPAVTVTCCTVVTFCTWMGKLAKRAPAGTLTLDGMLTGAETIVGLTVRVVVTVASRVVVVAMRAEIGTAMPPAGGAAASRTVAVTVSLGIAVAFDSVTLCTTAT